GRYGDFRRAERNDLLGEDGLILRLGRDRRARRGNAVLAPVVDPRGYTAGVGLVGGAPLDDGEIFVRFQRLHLVAVLVLRRGPRLQDPAPQRRLVGLLHGDEAIPGLTLGHR